MAAEIAGEPLQAGGDSSTPTERSERVGELHPDRARDLELGAEAAEDLHVGDELSLDFVGEVDADAEEAHRPLRPGRRCGDDAIDLRFGDLEVVRVGGGLDLSDDVLGVLLEGVLEVETQGVRDGLGHQLLAVGVAHATVEAIDVDVVRDHGRESEDVACVGAEASLICDFLSGGGFCGHDGLLMDGMIGVCTGVQLANISRLRRFCQCPDPSPSRPKWGDLPKV